MSRALSLGAGFSRGLALGVALTGALAGTPARASEIFLHYVAERYVIQTKFSDYENLSVLGFGGEYVNALTDYFHVRGVGGISIDVATNTPVFIEGGGGGALSIIGGAPLNITSSEMVYEAAPHQHLFFYLDFTQRLYDVTSTVPPPVQEKTGERRRVARRGTYITPKVGLGYDFYLNPKGFATIGVRAYATQSLNLEDLSIASFGAAVTLGFQFVDDIFMRFFQGGG